MKKLIYGLITLACLIACKSTSDSILYTQAITNAMSPNAKKIDTNLIAINADNQNLVRKKIQGKEYILVATWKKDTIHYKPNSKGFYNTRKFPIWITTAPELKNKIKKEKPKNLEHRLQQLLGLPPTADYKYFIEFWVQPKDLYRPCPDKEITDRKCDLCFPKKTDSTHISWINDYRINSYYACDLYNKYPWTQLGYTYDWNPKNKTHIGLSEFVIGENKDLIIHKIYTTEEYLR